MLSSTLLFLGGLAGLASVEGCGGPGHEVIRRNPGGPVAGQRGRKRDDSNPCSGYDYPPTHGLASRYPSTTEIASLLPSDIDARSLFNTIDSHVRSALPTTYPKGITNGDFSGVNYNGGEDADCWWTYTGCTSPNDSTGLAKDITTVPEPGSYGLTYDDGPNCGNAPLYNWMEQNDVRATLFYIGGNVLNWPLQAIAGHEGGHEICVHTWSHRYMTSLTNEQVFAELYYTQRVIKDVLGITPKCWRPPFGDVDNRVRMIAEGLGLTTIIWSEDTDDWSLDSGSAESKIDGNYQRFIDDRKNGKYDAYGPIVLAHELSDKTINEAIKFLPSLRSAFSHLLPISTAYNTTHPYVEEDIFYPSFADYVSGNEDPTVSSALPSSSAPSPTSSLAAPSSAASSAASSSPSSSAPAPSSPNTAPSSTMPASSNVSPSDGTSNHNAQPTSGAWLTMPSLGLAMLMAIVAVIL